MKKRIGITLTRTNYQNYPNWFETSDLKDDIEITALSFLQPDLSLLHGCHGIILTGGVDIEPGWYDGSAEYANRPDAFEPERDAFEAMVYRHAKSRGMPILGICRGMQFVNVLEGGKLIQDLGTAANEIHRKTADKDKEHRIEILEGSLLHSCTGTSSGKVNSAHHQSIDKAHLGKGLIVSAWTADGIPEALELVEKSQESFFLCVQWHPERMPDRGSNPLSKDIKDVFLGAVRKQNRKCMEVINPASEDVIENIMTDSPELLSSKMSRLQTAQVSWQSKSLHERTEILRGFHKLLGDEAEILSADLTAEVGKPLPQSRNEVNGARTRIAWMLEHADRYLSDEVMSQSSDMEERIRYEPLGVICNISAWNYPYLVGVNVFVPALLAGNAVMYKPSELALRTGLHIERLLKKAGVPDDVFQIAIGGPEVGQQLLELPFQGYFFTGSYKTGKHIYESVASRMVVCQCELGGKDPLYVADDVGDIKSVAIGTADGAFYNNGQSCCAVERIYVHEKVYDAYIDAFVQEVQSWKIGNPIEDGVYIGPMTRKANIVLLESQIADAVSKGAKVLTGGRRMQARGNFFEPTVLVDVDHTMSVMHEESFGPIIGIMKVKDDQEAVSLMADTMYGLTASVYTSDQKRGEAILNQLDTGTGYINCCDRVSAALPWSGRKHSGFGATLSHQGMRAFTRPKGIHIRKK